MTCVNVENLSGRARVLLLCEHASRAIPREYDDLGLAPETLASHCAWDIGALDLARRLSNRIDAPLVAATASRLLVDVNRALDAPDLIPSHAEGSEIPGNLKIGPRERANRIARFHAPFHDAIVDFMAERSDIVAIVSVHTFTSALLGKVRPWHAGVVFDQLDQRLADAAWAALAQETNLVVGRNEPYAPADGVYYTMTRHALPRGVASLMFEIRNDLVSAPTDSNDWAERLAHAVNVALAALGT